MKSTPTVLTESELAARAAEREERRAADHARDFARTEPRYRAVVASACCYPIDGTVWGLAHAMREARTRKIVDVSYVHFDSQGLRLCGMGKYPCEVLEVTEGSHDASGHRAGYHINYTVRLHPELRLATDVCM